MFVFLTLAALPLTLVTAVAKDPTPEQNMFCGIVYEAVAKVQTEARLQERFEFMSMAILLIESDSPNYDQRAAKARAAFAAARTKGGKDNLPKLWADCDKLGFED